MTTSDYRIEIYKTDLRYKNCERLHKVICLDNVTEKFAEGTASGLRKAGYRVVLTEQWVTVKSLMTGKDVDIRYEDRGTCVDPSREAYWTM